MLILRGRFKTTLLLIDEKGSILFLVLFITSVLMILGTSFLKNSFSERAIARNYEYKIRAHYIAEAGAEAALALISEQPGYFMKNALSGTPVHLGSGDEEGYFVLEWLQPGSPGGDVVYYTLQSRGYYGNTGNTAGGQAVVNVFLEIEGSGQQEDEESGESNGEEMIVRLIRWGGH
jgi:hypothetical protein